MCVDLSLHSIFLAHFQNAILFLCIWRSGLCTRKFIADSVAFVCLLTWVKLQKLIPIHPILGVHDWDAAEGAINWPRLVSFLQRVKDTGEIPPDHRSHDHLNEQKDIPIEGEVYQRLRDTFEQLETQMKDKGERILWGLVDGFLLYWDKVRYLHINISSPDTLVHRMSSTSWMSAYFCEFPMIHCRRDGTNAMDTTLQVKPITCSAHVPEI